MSRRRERDPEADRTPWRCGQFPTKRCYATMRAAEFAADGMRRREVDAHLVRVFECGTHLHVGHDTAYEPPHPRAVPEPLTQPLSLPPHLLALAAAAEAAVPIPYMLEDTPEEFRRVRELAWPTPEP